MATEDRRPPVAETASGALRGVWDGDLAIFRGVPFATPPLGDLRFRPPQPAAPWQGIRDATQFGPIAPQAPSRLGRVMGDFDLAQDEDCLTLNVWTPALHDKPAPVLVWLHGGANTSGGGSVGWYSGRELARNGGIVVVTVNYRLGALGFLRLQGVADGNMGILDQRLALRWVKENIASFGGDPAGITLAGQSAGARATSLHMAHPETAPLFRRAIMQSAPAGIRPIPPEQCEAAARDFLGILGLAPSEAASLRQVAPARLVAAYGELARRNKRFANSRMPFDAVDDGIVVRGDPVDAAARGEGIAIDLMIGTTRDESAAHFAFDDEIVGGTAAQVQEHFATVFGAAGDNFLAEYRRAWPGARPDRLLTLLATDATYHRGSIILAEARARLGHPAYLYRFDWQSPTRRIGACHCGELPFVFANFAEWPDAAMLAGADPEELAALSGAMHKAWIAFVRTGNPGHDGIPPWPPYQGESRMTMRFDTAVEPVGDLAGIAWRRPWPLGNGATA
ncbi:MAG: carboxylesterase type [Rhodospirillales bacterium]|nr:carboxylesterase type [Rhodospirillales bacterium]